MNVYVSLLVKDMGVVRVECDMDYGKYVSGGLNYVPCTVAIPENLVDKVMDVLVSYMGVQPGRPARTRFGTIQLDKVGGLIRLLIFSDALSMGVSFGEIVDWASHFIEGVVACLGGQSI